MSNWACSSLWMFSSSELHFATLHCGCDMLGTACALPVQYRLLRAPPRLTAVAGHWVGSALAIGVGGRWQGVEYVGVGSGGDRWECCVGASRWQLSLLKSSGRSHDQISDARSQPCYSHYYSNHTRDKLITLGPIKWRVVAIIKVTDFAFL